MDKEQENKTEENTTPVYPEPSRGSLSDDHSDYAKEIEFAGGDPDDHTKAYFIAFVIVMCLLFIFAVKSLSGGEFFF